MKTLKFLGIAAMVALMASCGGKSEKAEDAQAADEAAVSATDENQPIDITNVEVIDVEGEEGLEPDSDEAVEAETSADIDGLLKKYGDLLDKYTKVVKKVANGDMTAAAELTSLTSDYQELTKDLTALKDNMSLDQAKSFSDIAAKFAKEMGGTVGNIDVNGALDKLNLKK